MTCPDCKGTLIDITLKGIDKSFRCFRCGGVWVKYNTLSELSVSALGDWKPVVFENLDLSAGAFLMFLTPLSLLIFVIFSFIFMLCDIIICLYV